ncbi:glycosyltransferase [Limosilactobacillus reuteri]|uniref:glycosyltransferase n=1 Tax=Limosilactobacillus reuteri TaxID=1598 RepID=UPI00146D488B|nr:glycosyltransferase [Limosilactobacillus reuteri]
MNILFVSTVDLDKNGISTFIISHAMSLAKKNEVSIVAPNKVQYIIKRNLSKHNILLYEFPNRKKHPLKYFFNLISIIKNHHYDVLHVNGNSSTMALELIAGKIAGCKNRIAHSHNTTTEHPIINKILYPIFNFGLTERMACSDEAGKWLFKDKKFIIIQNGVDLRLYKPDIRKRNKIRNQFNLNDNDIVLGNIGVFNYQKNQQFLIKLLSDLNSSYKLILIGDGEKKSELLTQVKTLNLADRVIFAGKINNVSDYLSAFDLFLMPSRFEGLPFALVEAQASGLKCVVSNRISHSSNLTDNVNYLNIENYTKWVDFIKKIKIESFNSRIKNIQDIQELISNKGYDEKENLKLFNKTLDELLFLNNA